MRYQLVDVLKNRRWVKRPDPFPHVVARDVFVPSFYGVLIRQLRTLLGKGLSERPDPKRLSRSIAGYDAYAINLQYGQDGPFGIFLSRAWHDAVAGVFGVQSTGHVNCGLHHHAVGSSSGWIHNDLNPGWFVDGVACADPYVVEASRHDLCSYMSGETYQPTVRSRETIRAVALLYYLGNPPWKPGDGGSTALYRTKNDPVDRPARVVPPINNSLLAFECTPYSFHTFIGNWCSPRTCIIMWLHREKADVVARWGQGKIVEWPQANA